MDRKSLRDNSWGLEFRVGNVLRVGHMSLCQTGLAYGACPDVALGPLVLFGLASRFVRWVFVLTDFPASFFFLALGGKAKLREQLLPLQPC